MKPLASSLIILVSVALVASGCATMRYPRAYKVAGKEVKDFKELDDEKALKLVALIYNVRHENWEDGIARSIALHEYTGLLAKRKSEYIKNSGIFNIEYEKVDLAKWKDEDLVKLYDALGSKGESYYMDAAPELTEEQNAERIVCLTAMSALETEMKKRSNTRNVVSVASQVLLGVLSVALSMI